MENPGRVVHTTATPRAARRHWESTAERYRAGLGIARMRDGLAVAKESAGTATTRNNTKRSRVRLWVITGNT